MNREKYKVEVLLYINAARRACLHHTNSEAACMGITLYLQSSVEIDNAQETRMYRNILIATDGSELARKAVEHGVLLAK